MQITVWEQFIPDILPEVAQAPKSVIRRNVISTAISFFTKTGCWRKRLDPVLLLARQREVSLDNEYGTRVVSVMNVHDLTKDRKISRHDYYVYGDELILQTSYPEDRMLQIDASMKPTHSSKGLPTFLFEDWKEAIVYGSIASLKAMRGREWEDATGAQVRFTLFNDFIAEAKGKMGRGGSSEMQRINVEWIG